MMSRKAYKISINWEDYLPTDLVVTPLTPVIIKGSNKRGPKVTRHASFLGFGRKDPFSMTKKDPYHLDNNVQLENFTYTSQYDQNRAAVVRSRSFGGMATRTQHMQTPSGAPVLGESLRAKGHWTVNKTPQNTRSNLGISFNKKLPRVPKIPRPNRALLMFDSVKMGVREFIQATREDIDVLHSRGIDHTSTAQGKILETDKQIKAAQRYLKRLEFHLAKIEELHDHYLVQQQMREGTRTMQKAYITSPHRKKDSMERVRYGIKECSQTMCSIEAQLESMMGAFNCKLKGMAGFARLCPGDVFEIIIKHGTQKWKSKGKVERSGNQRWDNPEHTFKAVIGDVMNIKGVELRSFKSVILGQKSCEVKDLFSANPQLMTVSINANGSLKLSIIITWNPLEGVEETMPFFDVPLRSQSTPRRRPVSVLALNGELAGSYGNLTGPERRYSTPFNLSQTKDDNFILRTSTSTSAQSSPLNRGHALHRDSGFSSAIYLPGTGSPPVSSKKPAPQPPVNYASQNRVQAASSSPNIPIGQQVSPPGLEISSSPVSHSHQVSSSSLNNNLYSNVHFPIAMGHTVTLTKDEPINVEDAVNCLSTALEDYHGQYRELEKLEDVVVMLEQVLRKESRCSSRSSSISISIESALGAFDFLNTEDTVEETETHGDSSVFDNVVISPESTAKTGDSGIESLAKRLSEDTTLGSSLGSSPLPSSTGNEQVDQALVFHLVYCERLLESLGSFGPLKCREIYALDRLQKQAQIIEDLVKISQAGPETDLHAVLTTLCDDKSLREFWVRCTDQNVLFIHPEKLVTSFEQKYGAQLKSKYDKDPHRVLRHLVMRILDVPHYDPEKIKSTCIVTLHQFMRYFKDEGGLQNVDAVASELQIIEKLCSGKTDSVIKTVLALEDSLPPAPCLKVIGALLVSVVKDVAETAELYLERIQKQKECREKAMLVFVEGLEDKTQEVRAGSCEALGILESSEAIEQLAYICQTDTSMLVRVKSKEALISFGEAGRRAFEEIQLSKHGFQGLQVRK